MPTYLVTTHPGFAFVPGRPFVPFGHTFVAPADWSPPSAALPIDADAVNALETTYTTRLALFDERLAAYSGADRIAMSRLREDIQREGAKRAKPIDLRGKLPTVEDGFTATEIEAVQIAQGLL